MSDSILEQILQSVETRLAEIRTANQYETEMGAEVIRHFIPALNYAFLPCVGFAVGTLENSELYTRKESNEMPLAVQGVAAYSDSVTASKMAVKLLADIAECILSTEYTIDFVSGGTTEIVPGNAIEGATSGAIGKLISVSTDSGTWGAGNAAGSMVARRVVGIFQDAENINVGANPNLATIDGAPSGKSPIDLIGGGLIDGISFLNSQFYMPEADHKSVGVGVRFAVRYKTIAGNPYSQT